MDKHEILEKSRKENRGGDERETQITAKAWQLGAAVGIVICGIAMTVFGLVFDEPMKYMADNMMIYFGMIATVYTYKSVKLESAARYGVCLGFLGVFYLLYRDICHELHRVNGETAWTTD